MRNSLKNPVWSVIAHTVSLLLCLLWAGSMAASGATVEQWRVMEIVLHSAKQYADPFEEVEVTAAFTGPNGEVVKRPAFWDGGSVWKVRFAPTKAGRWTYTTNASDPKDTGLQGQRGSLICVPYTGRLPIYRRGFLRVSADRRHLAYRDGTPFFWLADTHWLWEKERMDASNRPGWSSQFQGMADRRVEQGFTVYQVELFGRWTDAPLGGSAVKGTKTLNLAHFQTDIDPKWRYLAEKGLVVAATLGILPKNVTPEQGKEEARMARYVCARYGAYPAVWLMYQECTANLKEQFADETDRQVYKEVVRGVGRAYQQADGYHQLRTAHSDSSVVTAYRGEDWLDFTLFQGGHGKTIDCAPYLDFYFDPKTTLPQIEGEANYEYLFDGSEANQSSLVTTDAMREKAYRAIQSGCCGYTYGANGVWQATWDNERTGNQTVYGTTPWWEGIDLPGGEQMKYLKAFYTALPWERLIPRPECDGFLEAEVRLTAKQRRVAATDPVVNTFVVYFSQGAPFACTLKQLQNAPYSARWFNPRAGTYTLLTSRLMPQKGVWRCPGKPDNSDWLLVLTANRPISAGNRRVTSRWNTVKAARERERGQNAARSAKVSASSTDLANKVYAPENATDGRADTNDWHHWSNDAKSDPASAAKPVWLLLEWEKPVTIRKIVFYTMQGYETQDYAFEYDDGSGWKTVPGTETKGNTETVREHPLIKPLTMRRLRFLGRRGSVAQPYIVRVVEIEAIQERRIVGGMNLSPDKSPAE